MVESFKITAKELRRYLKIHVSMPDDYNEYETKYPLVIVFDGDLMFNFIDENTKKFDTESMLSGIKDKALFVCLHSPSNPSWRMSELNPYYNGNDKDVDKVLSFIYFEYITNTVLPLLLERYRIDEKEIYLAGFNEGAIAALSMVYTYKEYKGAALFNPSLNICSDKLHEDMKMKFTCKKSIYLYRGGLDSSSKEDDLFYHLCTRFDSYKTEILLYNFDSSMDNSYLAIGLHFKEGILHILKNKTPEI